MPVFDNIDIWNDLWNQISFKIVIKGIEVKNITNGSFSDFFFIPMSVLILIFGIIYRSKMNLEDNCQLDSIFEEEMVDPRKT